MEGQTFKDGLFAGSVISALVCAALLVIYMMVEYNRVHTYPFNDRTCVVQYGAVITCYDTPEDQNAEEPSAGR